MEKVFFSLGSNRGDRFENLENSLDALSGVCRGLEASRVYETEPLYVHRQSRFLNLAAAGFVSLEPEKLLNRLHKIERNLGRVRGLRFGPRPIDIDILLFGDRVLTGDGLTLPHPRLTERRFVLRPLLELAPGLADPVSGEPFWKSLLTCRAGGVYFHSLSRYTKSSLIPLGGMRFPAES